MRTRLRASVRAGARQFGVWRTSIRDDVKALLLAHYTQADVF